MGGERLRDGTAGQRLRNLRSLLRDPAQLWRGGGPFACPLCGHEGRFLSSGDGRRPQAMCPRCGGLGRQRLLALWAFGTAGDRLAGQRILHIAPEAQLRRLLRGRPGYETADLKRADVDHRIDICAMPFADGTYDLLLCAHVLEHVPDDRAAMAEFRRVLRPGGLAALMVPLSSRPETDEDPSVTSPADRRRRFGQHDHLRLYGQDFTERLRAAGLAPKAFRATPEQAARHAIAAREQLILARPA